MKNKILKRLRKGDQGIAFLALFPILAAAIFLANDFPRALILQQRMRQVADGCALAAAGGLDEGHMITAQDPFAINKDWAQARADMVVAENTLPGALGVPAWMHVDNCQLTIDGSDHSVLVTVNGSVTNAFASGIGAPDSFSTTVTSKARAAIGITGDSW